MPSAFNIHPPERNDDSDAFAVRSDPKLIAEGWVRRHLADPDRAKEAIELYTSMGFEVKAQELKPEDFGAQCQECASIVCRSYVLIYTRERDADRSLSSTPEPPSKD